MSIELIALAEITNNMVINTFMMIGGKPFVAEVGGQKQQRLLWGKERSEWFDGIVDKGVVDDIPISAVRTGSKWQLLRGIDEKFEPKFDKILDVVACDVTSLIAVVVQIGSSKAIYTLAPEKKKLVAGELWDDIGRAQISPAFYYGQLCFAGIRDEHGFIVSDSKTFELEEVPLAFWFFGTSIIHATEKDDFIQLHLDGECINDKLLNIFSIHYNPDTRSVRAIVRDENMLLQMNIPLTLN